jgi:hypothetical protein
LITLIIYSGQRRGGGGSSSNNEKQAAVIVYYCGWRVCVQTHAWIFQSGGGSRLFAGARLRILLRIRNLMMISETERQDASDELQTSLGDLAAGAADAGIAMPACELLLPQLG